MLPHWGIEALKGSICPLHMVLLSTWPLRVGSRMFPPLYIHGWLSVYLNRNVKVPHWKRVLIKWNKLSCEALKASERWFLLPIVACMHLDHRARELLIRSAGVVGWARSPTYWCCYTQFGVISAVVSSKIPAELRALYCLRARNYIARWTVIIFSCMKGRTYQGISFETAWIGRFGPPRRIVVFASA